MKTRNLGLLFAGAFAIAITLGSCSGRKGGAAEAEDTPIIKTDSVSWSDSLTVGDCRADVEISGAYPSQGKQPLVDSIQYWLGARLSTNVMNAVPPLFTPTSEQLASGSKLAEASGQALLKSAATDFKGFAQDEMSINYEFSYIFGPQYTSDKVATYFFTGYGYMGGAHGSTLGDTQSFDAQTGAKLTYANVFGPDAEAKLIKRVRDGLWDQYFKDMAGEGTTLADMLLVNPDALTLPQTPPTFVENGIIFIYQQYEIAPYAAGMPQCMLPYSEMKPLMTEAASRLVP